jgi:hypothetical protein
MLQERRLARLPGGVDDEKLLLFYERQDTGDTPERRNQVMVMLVARTCDVEEFFHG